VLGTLCFDMEEKKEAHKKELAGATMGELCFASAVLKWTILQT